MVILGFIVGVGLLIAAIAAVAGKHDIRAQLSASFADGPWWIIALACLLPAVNWVLTSATFWALTARFGEVRFIEMSWAIGAAWVFNYLPLRPGMLGRFAYHKIVHGVRVRDSARVVVEAMLASIVGGAVMLGLALAMPAQADASAWVIVLAAPMVLSAIAAAALWKRGAWGVMALAGALRYGELLVWLGRYAIAFFLIGAPIDFRTACIVTVVSQLMLTIPISGNGLGVREWGVGLTAGALYAAGAIDAPDVNAATALGLAADLVVRGMELLPAVVVGVLSSTMIFRHVRRTSRAQP